MHTHTHTHTLVGFHNILEIASTFGAANSHDSGNGTSQVLWDAGGICYVYRELHSSGCWLESKGYQIGDALCMTTLCWRVCWIEVQGSLSSPLNMCVYVFLSSNYICIYIVALPCRTFLSPVI